MKCPSCGSHESKVIDSRPVEENNSIRRRRECLDCHMRFTTYEVIDVYQPVVLKKDGTKELFDKNKLLTGLLKAGLIEAVGRKDTVGRPLLYGTTDEFLKKFQISSIEDLPDYDEVLENLMILNAPSQETLFHNRTIMDEDELESETLAGQAAADSQEDEEEIPEFLEGENFEVFD